MKNSIVTFLILWICTIINAQEAFFPKLDSLKKTWSFIDVNGKPVLEIPYTTIQDIRLFSNDLVAAQHSKTKLWGYLNSEGKWQIKPQFDEAKDFNDGYAITYILCKTGCITVTEGILTTHNGQIIDKNGNVILKDKAQHINDRERYLFDKNLGHGFFSISYGFGDEKGVVDLKGKEICSSGDVVGPNGFIIYDEELKALRCANKYYKPTGEIILDISTYSYIKPFENGTTWGLFEEETGYDEYTYFHVLIDKTGNEIFRIDYETAAETKAFSNGKFQYLGNDGELYEYDIANSKTTLIPNNKVDNSDITIGSTEKNGCQLIYTTDSTERLIGFRNKDGRMFYK